MSMKKTFAACAVAGAAGLAAAPAALAVPRIKPPDIPFPADQIEVRVERHCEEVEGIYEQFGRDGCVDMKTWITSDRDHEVALDTRTGQLIAENATVDGTVFSWTSRGNGLFVVSGHRPDRPSNITYEAQAAVTRELVRTGHYVVSGEEVRDGRAVVILTDSDDAPLAGDLTKVVDKETYQTLESKYVSHDGQQQFHATFVSVERIARTAETEKLLRMGEHPGAKVIRVEGPDEDTGEAARKAGLKKGTRAQIAKKFRAAKKGRR